MGRPRIHDHETRSLLLAAAERLLAAEGVEGLTARRLADEAGVSVRAIYSLFENMNGVTLALGESAFEALCSELRAIPLSDDVLEDVVAAGATGFRNWSLSHPDLFRLVFVTPGPVPEGPVLSKGAEAFDLLRARVSRCAEAGLITSTDVEALALAFHAQCEGLASLERRRRFPIDPMAAPADTWRTSLRAVVRGFLQPVATE